MLNLRNAWRQVGVEAGSSPALSPPDSLLLPTRADIQDCLDSERWLDYTHCSIDIEAAGHFITVIGFTFFDIDSNTTGPTWVIHFKKQGGDNYFDEWDDHVLATELVMRIMEYEGHTKVMHNGISFDVPMLEEAGMSVGGELLDTLVLAHYILPEMKKGLQFLSTTYLGAPAWKKMLDAKDEHDGKA